MGELDISCADLQLFKQVDIRTVEPESLVDIKNITIDATLPREKRIAEFMKMIKNPYCFRVGKIIVGVGYSDDGVSFEQRMESYLQTL